MKSLTWHSCRSENLLALLILGDRKTNLMASKEREKYNISTVPF
jgi:hypothetical protein